MTKKHPIKNFIVMIRDNTGFGHRPLVLFFIINVALVWIKSILEYQINFNLGVDGSIQQFTAIFNPIPTAMLLIGIGLFFRGRKAYWIMLFFNFVQSAWLFANVLYYREFSDFISFGIIGSTSSVENNFGKAVFAIVRFSDFFIFLDIVILAILLIAGKLTIDKIGISRKFAFLTTALSLSLMLVGLGVSSQNRSGLLTRSFDNHYIVKYLGLNEYAAVNAVQTVQQNSTRQNAKNTDLDSVQQFINQNKVPVNVSYFGTQKGKNVFAFHLESFQQFLIDYQVDNQEVTPNLNAFYHDANTISFDNFYHQVGQGKTADAELMLDNSLFGLPSGAAMTKYGTENTFQAAPAILDQQGYTSAVFHGDVASFWNRDNTYKSWGFDYFFSKPYYKNADDKVNNIGYGLKDKIFLRESAEYIEQLPQPFYSKVITVTNHYPYEVNQQMAQDFPATQTGDDTVDSYVQTAHYLDQSFKEFTDWLKATGLYDNSLIYLYGDHYGISENHRDAIAQLLGKTELTNYDLAQFQKVPFMVHAPGLQGGINHTYGGEIDVLPTLLDLLGVANDDSIQLGHDLLSPQNQQIVAFRNGDWATPRIIKFKNQYFIADTGEQLDLKTIDQETRDFIDQTQKYVDNQLTNSDKVITGDLLRFDQRPDFKPVDKSLYNYSFNFGVNLLKQVQTAEPSSLLAKNGGISTMDLYPATEENTTAGN